MSTPLERRDLVLRCHVCHVAFAYRAYLDVITGQIQGGQPRACWYCAACFGQRLRHVSRPDTDAERPR